jgi:hypothetical protein
MSTDVLEVRAASIIALMEEAGTSETSVYIQLRTWRYIPEDSEPQDVTRCSASRPLCKSWLVLCFSTLLTYYELLGSL